MLYRCFANGFLIVASALLLSVISGCGAGSLFLKEADLSALDRKVFEQQQWATHLSEQQSLLGQRQQEMIERLTALMERPDALAGVQSEIQLINAQLTQTQAQIKQLSASIRRLEKNNNSQSRPGSALVSNPIAAEETSSKLIVGEIEVVQLSPPGLRFPARIDTGAETSSLDAREMKVFERDGDRWVRFQTIDPQTGEAIPLEARVSRKARILQSSFDESERRPVVELSVTIGHITQLAEFTLSDRSHLSFPVLIGRNVLRDMMLVDVGLSHTMNQIPSPAASNAPNNAAESDTVEP